ncbi:putative peptidase family-domain-containing protein [Flagelloscypha sp. PMI_526]|nr:putative peptidase family-domain-containing protein [Flagelloscypha sp. PMI_526]
MADSHNSSSLNSDHSEGKIVLSNLGDNETVHQRCLLLKGSIVSRDPIDNQISISTLDEFKNVIFPEQRWPVHSSSFKALVFLAPGENIISFRKAGTDNGEVTRKRTVTYVPSQAPPLHLAIMVAKDSLLEMDCPPNKPADLHASLDAAVAKFRLAAYMWQAMTAEDMRMKGLGRRSFALEEEMDVDTVSSNLNHSKHSTAKVHIIRSEKTLAELRDPEVAQQNQAASNSGRQELHPIFSDAIRAHGNPFPTSGGGSDACIIAGLILDSHYSSSQDLILAHAALGGASLGIFGSHTCWSWPRSIEEVSSCLLDNTPSDPSVGNDCGECGTAWEACAIGQGAFLHEVGHAFGCAHTSGIMMRGYARDWVKHFVPRVASGVHPRAVEGAVIEGVTKNDAVWDFGDALRFRLHPHFKLPSDPPVDSHSLYECPTVDIRSGDDQHATLHISCSAGLARIAFSQTVEASPTPQMPTESREYNLAELATRFKRDEPLRLVVFGMNGKEKVVGDVWSLQSLRARSSSVRVPGSDLVLKKRSVKSYYLEAHEHDPEHQYWEWSALFIERGQNGKRKLLMTFFPVSHATAFDMRIGCILDGGVLYYDDNHHTHLGPRFKKDGSKQKFGGHLSQKLLLSANITKVEVHRSNDLMGIRTHLSDGTVAGELNEDNLQLGASIITLEPSSPDERIIGFFGRSDWDRGFNGIQEFGIILAPKLEDGKELPETIYDLSELQNTDGGGVWKVKPHLDKFSLRTMLRRLLCVGK